MFPHRRPRDVFCFHQITDGNDRAGAEPKAVRRSASSSGWDRHSGETKVKKQYEKPSLKPLGLLRSVTKCTLTGIVNVCWIAAAVFEESLVTGPRVNKVRTWLLNDFEPSGAGARLVMRMYRKYGERAAKVVGKNSLLKRGFRKLFDVALAKAEAKYGTL
jgi:hypothetical protein